MDKILFVIGKNGMGGVQLRTKRLYRALGNYFESSLSVSLIEIDADESYLPFLWKVFKSEKVSLTITVFGRDALILLLIASIFKRSVKVYHIQAVPINLPMTNYFTNFVRWVGCKILVRLSYKVICVSAEIQREISKIGGRCNDKVICIYNPILGNDFELRKTIRNTINFKFKATLKLVSVGRISKQKNFEFLLEVVASLLKKGIDVELLIIGPGDRANLSNRLVALGLVDKVTLLGELENPLKLVGKADVFCLCSLWEGFPSVLIESIFLGTPVVSVDCPSGPSEIITDTNGVLCEGYSVNQFTEAVISVSQKTYSVPEMKASVLHLFDHVSARKHAQEIVRCMFS